MANTVIDIAERKYYSCLSANGAAYAISWQKHEEMLRTQGKAYRLFEEVFMGFLLAPIPGGVGGAIGKTLKSLAASDPVIDGVMDLVKFELRSPIASGVMPPRKAGNLFNPMPAIRLVWQNFSNQRAQEELAGKMRCSIATMLI